MNKLKNMSVNQKSKTKKISESDSFLLNSINFVQVKNKGNDGNNKRYSNSSNKNNSYMKKEKYEEFEKLNNIYASKENEYNTLLNQYKEILGSLNQKKDFLIKNKIKYQSLINNNNNMKIMLLKLIKIEEE